MAQNDSGLETFGELRLQVSMRSKQDPVFKIRCFSIRRAPPSPAGELAEFPFVLRHCHPLFPQPGRVPLIPAFSSRLATLPDAPASPPRCNRWYLLELPPYFLSSLPSSPCIRPFLRSSVCYPLFPFLIRAQVFNSHFFSQSICLEILQFYRMIFAFRASVYQLWTICMDLKQVWIYSCLRGDNQRRFRGADFRPGVCPSWVILGFKYNPFFSSELEPYI